MKDIKFESDAIISFQDIDFSSFGCGMKKEAKAVIAEVEGNNVRLILVGHGQTACPTAADAAESFGIRVPSLRNDLQAAILDVLPKPGSSATNPIDIAHPYVSPQYIGEILLHASRDENVDFHIVIQLLYHYKALQLMMGGVKLNDITPYKELAKVCREAMDIGKNRSCLFCRISGRTKMILR